MSELLFMSPQHVARMNEILAHDGPTRRACAELEQDMLLAYELSDGEDTIWWTMAFRRDEGVRFGLDAPARAVDLTLRGEYRAMLDFMRLSKSGQAAEEPVSSHGDPEVLTIIGPAFAAAQAAATLDTVIPEA